MKQNLRHPSRALTLLALLGMVLGSTGCHHSYYQNAQYLHCLDSCFARKRATVQAWYVWLQCRDECCCERVSDYRRGFIQGYCDVAMGGDGCVPVVPPRRYWGWCHQNESGQECVAAWYEGYPLGCAAATQVGCHYEIPTIVPEDPQFASFQKEFDAACGEEGCATGVSPGSIGGGPSVMTPSTDYITAPPAPLSSSPIETVEPVRVLPASPGYEDDASPGVDTETDNLIKTPEAPPITTDATAIDVNAASFGEEDLLDTLEQLDREARKLGK